MIHSRRSRHACRSILQPCPGFLQRPLIFFFDNAGLASKHQSKLGPGNSSDTRNLIEMLGGPGRCTKFENRVKNDRKMIPKWFQNDPQDPRVNPKRSQNDPRMISEWSQNDPQMIPEWSQNDFRMLPKRSQNDPTMILKLSQNDVNTFSKWCQSAPEMIPKLLINI